MSFRINKDWDLCWYHLSNTGCRNSKCTWRHENSVGRFYQNYTNKTRGEGANYRGDARKKRGAPFFPIKHHQDGGVEDQHGLIHYPDIVKKNGNKKSFNFRIKRGCRRESEHTRPTSSPMSVSSSCWNSAPTSIANSMTTSQGGSDSEGDVVKDIVVVSTIDLGKSQKRNGCVFSEGLLEEFTTPRRQNKMKWVPDKPISSSLSPLAKVFVPLVKPVISIDANSAGLNEMTLKDLAIE